MPCYTLYTQLSNRPIWHLIYTTASRPFQSLKSLALRVVVAWIASASVGGMIWSSTLWTHACTLNSANQERYRLEVLSNVTSMIYCFDVVNGGVKFRVSNNPDRLTHLFYLTHQTTSNWSFFISTPM
jgi:hypothetical protein